MSIFECDNVQGSFRMINYIEGVPMQFLSKLRAPSLLPQFLSLNILSVNSSWIVRERIIQNNLLGLPNYSGRSVESSQWLCTPVCTPSASIDSHISLFLPPSSSTGSSVWYTYCPPFFSPPWLPHAIGFFLDLNIQLILLWWTNMGAVFGLTLENPWT